MNRLLSFMGTGAVFVSALVVFISLLTAPWNTARGVGTWTYPETSEERLVRIKTLDGHAEEKNKAFETQMAFLSGYNQALAQLESEIRSVQGALTFHQRPLQAAMENYRKVQELSLSDPMISTEPQRLEYIKVKEKTAEVVNQHRAKVAMLQEQLPLAREKIASARLRLNIILRELDSVIKHRDAISEIMFVKSVAD